MTEKFRFINKHQRCQKYVHTTNQRQPEDQAGNTNTIDRKIL